MKELEEIRIREKEKMEEKMKELEEVRTRENDKMERKIKEVEEAKIREKKILETKIRELEDRPILIPDLRPRVEAFEAKIRELEEARIREKEMFEEKIRAQVAASDREKEILHNNIRDLEDRLNYLSDPRPLDELELHVLLSRLKDFLTACERGMKEESSQQLVSDAQLNEVASLLQHILSSSATTKEKPSKSDVPKISFLEFNVGDIALFLPTNKKDTFLAFTHYLPHYYLSQDSLQYFKDAKGEAPNYIMGEILMIEERTFSKDVPSNIGSDKTPRLLHNGMKYHLLDVKAVDFSKPH